MEMESTHLMQGGSVDSVQHAIPQVVQRMMTDSAQQESADGMQQRTTCLTEQDAKQIFGTKTATITGVDEDQTVCSKSTEADISNRADGQVPNFQDSQEPGTTWQDDEHEYETQMNLLKYDVEFFFLNCRNQISKLRSKNYFQNCDIFAMIIESLIRLEN